MAACHARATYVPRSTQHCDAVAIVREHWPAFRERVETHAGPVPAFVRDEIEAFAASVTDAPPDVVIDIRSSVQCPTRVRLDATLTDPDGDVDTVRWRANGHLLAPHVEEVIVSSGATTFTVVACDNRVGCTRADKTVECT